MTEEHWDQLTFVLLGVLFTMGWIAFFGVPTVLLFVAAGLFLALLFAR